MFPGFRLGISSLDWAVAPNQCDGQLWPFTMTCLWLSGG